MKDQSSEQNSDQLDQIHNFNELKSSIQQGQRLYQKRL
ncbi:unnamed protein product [Paramecium octaurelia]|uniref:Uncharacterized protein n=1 Tax=Paramecium octaurelia TaxID=43137 RepID=A0A8S1TRA2_PAROT|nr:unnamed protein product [Paramecium octaurelia]